MHDTLETSTIQESVRIQKLTKHNSKLKTFEKRIVLAPQTWRFVELWNTRAPDQPFHFHPCQQPENAVGIYCGMIY